MTSTLDAINEIFEWCQMPPVAALDPDGASGTSDEADAQRILERVSKETQERHEWYVCREELSLGVPDVKIAVSGGSGTFSYGETVTEAVSGATGTFDHILDGFMYINSAAGTFTGGQTLTGQTSAATRTGGAYTAITESRIALNPDEIIRVRPSTKEGESARIVTRGEYFWDTENGTYTFTESLELSVVRLLDIDEMTGTLASHIIKEAAWAFMRYKFPGRVDSEDRRNERRSARAAALKEDTELKGTNLLNTAEVRRIKGDRYEGTAGGGGGGEPVRTV